MLIRTLIFTTAFLGATIAAAAAQPGVTGDFKTYEAAKTFTPAKPSVASTENAGVYTPHVSAATVMCKGKNGAPSITYYVSVENGICGSVPNGSAKCISYDPPALAMATCFDGCRSTTGSGKCKVL